MHSPSAPTSRRSSAPRASSAITPSRSGATGTTRNVAPLSVETATCGSDWSVQPPSVARSRVPSGACASSNGPSGTPPPVAPADEAVPPTPEAPGDDGTAEPTRFEPEPAPGAAAPRVRGPHVVQRRRHQHDVNDREYDQTDHACTRQEPPQRAAGPLAAPSHVHPGIAEGFRGAHGPECTDPAALRRNRYGVSRIIVIGPSFTDATCMFAPKMTLGDGRAQISQRGAERLVERLGDLAGRRRDPGRPPSLPGVAVQRELADHQHRRPEVGGGLLLAHDPQPPDLARQPVDLARAVGVRHAEQHQQPWAVDRADDLPVHGDGGGKNSLDHGTHQEIFLQTFRPDRRILTR